MAAEEEPSEAELEAAHCWEADDRVPGRPEMTAFRRRARLRQARWRERNEHPIGTQPIVPLAGKGARAVGSRLPLEYAQTTGANFVTPSAVTAAQRRAATKEPRQSFDHQRFWADLLWAPSFGVNLFGDLSLDLARADRAVHTWWPDAPGKVSALRFTHSPGWLDPEYLGNLIPFDVAIELALGDGERGIIGLATKYHDRLLPQTPKPTRLARYRAVAKRSGAFARGATDDVDADLVVIWLQHLLVWSMLQHPGGTWRWGRFVIVHAEDNRDFATAATRYRDRLRDLSTFGSVTAEALLASRALPRTATATLRDRYFSRS